MSIFYIAILILIFVIIGLLFHGISQLISTVFGSPYFKSPDKVVKAAIKMAEIKPGEVFYDLGCGSGRIVKYVADNFNVQACGVEISPIQYLKARILTIDNKNIKIKCANLKKINLKSADIIYCYLRIPTMNQLEEKFKKELKKNTRVVCLDFPLPNIKPIKNKKIGKATLYLYKF